MAKYCKVFKIDHLVNLLTCHLASLMKMKGVGSHLYRGYLLAQAVITSDGFLALKFYFELLCL